MKKLFILFLVIVVCIASCTNSSINEELKQIENLLQQNQTDQAYKFLSEINTDNIDEGDRAYYNLLLTEAQYKKYIPFTSDSTINSVVNYYEHNSDCDKYTKALIFQGCVFEDMGEPEIAVKCYHKAESSMPKDDLKNLAYSKLRLGNIYQSSAIGSSTIALQKYQEALSLYKKIHDNHYQMICLTEIGGLYRTIKNKEDSAECYINNAIKLAIAEKNQNVLYSNFNFFSGVLL